MKDDSEVLVLNQKTGLIEFPDALADPAALDAVSYQVGHGQRIGHRFQDYDRRTDIARLQDYSAASSKALHERLID
jgi:hypothetical protein